MMDLKENERMMREDDGGPKITNNPQGYKLTYK